MSDRTDAPSEALRAAAAKRVQLKEALSRAEVAAASPSAATDWRPKLVAELEVLRTALDEHVEEVEAEDGLLTEMMTLAPRLANMIDHMRDEHPELCRQVADTIELAGGDASVAAVRTAVLDTLQAIARHRQKGADLVFEGYDVDIGGGG